MKNSTLILSLFLLLASCDDGDIIVTDFDFENETLLTCGDIFEPSFIFYKINQDSNEAIALQFTVSSDTIFMVPSSTPYQISLSGNDKLSYRRFNESVPTDYFCNPIPPATPTVQEEFVSTIGEVQILTQGVLVDADGIPSDLEVVGDTDEDGLPDIYDFDDDGDNVPTIEEGLVITNGAIDLMLSRDTDGDTILDYLDEDDDGDGILTRNEDINMDGNPTNDNSSGNPDLGADYLNSEIAVETEVTFYRQHTYFITNITLGVEIENINLINQANQNEQRNETSQNFGTLNTPDVEVTRTPFFN